MRTEVEQDHRLTACEFDMLVRGVYADEQPGLPLSLMNFPMAVVSVRLGCCTFEDAEEFGPESVDWVDDAVGHVLRQPDHGASAVWAYEYGTRGDSDDSDCDDPDCTPFGGCGGNNELWSRAWGLGHWYYLGRRLNDDIYYRAEGRELHRMFLAEHGLSEDFLRPPRPARNTLEFSS